MRRLSIAVTCTLILCWLLYTAPSSPVGASEDFVTLKFSGNGTCTSTSISVPIDLTWSVSGGLVSTTSETVNGASVINGSFPNSLSGSGSGAGLTQNHAPFSATEPYVYTFSISYQEGVGIIGGASASFTCENGVAVLAGASAGPSVPSGFVLRFITCDTTVFESAGGRPVSTGERITAGQTWFINPVPVKVTDNTLYPSWTEIFVGGAINGFIPTVCVGGAPVITTGGPKPTTLSGDASGLPTSCIPGSMLCSGAAGFLTCDKGTWVYRNCAPGTVCKQFGSAILCDWPS